jgi:hypothetical protein
MARDSRRASLEAFLAAAQNKHEADAACRTSTGAIKDNTRAACISIINNQDLDRASRPPTPPAIKAHQPSSAQCISAAQAHPDTHNSSCRLPSLCIYHSSQTETPPQCCCQRAGVSDLEYDVSSAVRPCTAFVTDPNSKHKLCPCWSCPTKNLTSDFPFPSLWDWDSFSRLVSCCLAHC